MSHSREDILSQTRKILVELFELEQDELTENARIYEDLDIDSIDTVDLLIELKRFTGKCKLHFMMSILIAWFGMALIQNISKLHAVNY